MPQPMTFDIVSDISCPWCVIGLRGLERALLRVGDLVQAEIRIQPFELNPDMPPGGQSIVEAAAARYGTTPVQSAASRAELRRHAAELGFDMAMSDQSRIYNTFDAHRLLHWAGPTGRQLALKHGLFAAYFTDGLDPSSHDVLVAAAASAALDPAVARQVLGDARYADEVRAAERHWRREGVAAVPTIIVNDRQVISGAQPPEKLERAIRTLAAEAAQADRATR